MSCNLHQAEMLIKSNLLYSYDLIGQAKLEPNGAKTVLLALDLNQKLKTLNKASTSITLRIQTCQINFALFNLA